MAYNRGVLPTMAIFLSLGIPPGGTPIVFTSVEKVATTLRSLGHGFTPEGATGTQGTLTRGEASCTVWISKVIVDGDAPERYTLPWLTFTVEFAAPRRIPSAKVPAWTALHLPRSASTFASHLGGTATASLNVDVQKGIARDDLRGLIEGFFRDGEAFARAQGGEFRPAPPFDPARSGLNDDTRVDAADYLTFDRVAAVCGWTPLPATAYQSYGWLKRYTVAGQPIGLAGHVEKGKTDPNRVDAIRFTKEGILRGTALPIDGPDAVSRPVILLGDGWHVPASRITLDLTNGLPLGEIRRRVEAFAKREERGLQSAFGLRTLVR